MKELRSEDWEDLTNLHVSLQKNYTQEYYKKFKLEIEVMSVLKFDVSEFEYYLKIYKKEFE